MTPLPHIPALRLGQPYASLDRVPVADCRTGRPIATLSQVNAGVVRKDLGRIAASRNALRALPAARLLEICARAGDLFLHGTLPMGDSENAQSPDDYVGCLAATSGLPHALVRRNMDKIARVLTHMATVLNGFSRGLDLGILDRGWGEQFGTRLSFHPTAQALGVVMPSNSPAVNSLWLPAIPLKVPVVLKPGREEPWTPFRLIQALIAAGCPREAFGFYPTDREGAAVILNSCGRALLFGGREATAQYAGNPGIQIHGPGLSKILLGEDQADRWPEFMDVLVASISDNGGRSCVNASAVLTPRHADAIADALAQRLGLIEPRPARDPEARLSAFANRTMADSIQQTIEEGLAVSGAIDVTAQYRHGPRQVEFEGAVYLRPTVVRCDSMNHPLANREFLFPYASVVEVPQNRMLEEIGPSLAVTAITKDPDFASQLLDCPLIERLNLGPISTMTVSWDQPHEGNLFDFLYKRRPLERAPGF